jgi:hypothetical protein
VKSETGIYHVMLRGINQTQLFYDDVDRIAFMDRLKRYRDECGEGRAQSSADASQGEWPIGSSDSETDGYQPQYHPESR